MLVWLSRKLVSNVGVCVSMVCKSTQLTGSFSFGETWPRKYDESLYFSKDFLGLRLLKFEIGKSGSMMIMKPVNSKLEKIQVQVRWSRIAPLFLLHHVYWIHSTLRYYVDIFNSINKTLLSNTINLPYDVKNHSLQTSQAN